MKVSIPIENSKKRRVLPRGVGYSKTLAAWLRNFRRSAALLIQQVAGFQVLHQARAPITGLEILGRVHYPPTNVPLIFQKKKKKKKKKRKKEKKIVFAFQEI
ncbi:hypothetical protein PoB_001723200 [Plakobranchus ocellatus]|uniref:Uncharacterized protein n=1 Tax=Plakobranchus ocellatus TaxID=259542 RepID=A0AAV3Z883_9GAST|nr:hypothetical protein PoB_001723200 [Plakobranchus ocellatus]